MIDRYTCEPITQIDIYNISRISNLLNLINKEMKEKAEIHENNTEEKSLQKTDTSLVRNTTPEHEALGSIPKSGKVLLRVSIRDSSVAATESEFGE